MWRCLACLTLIVIILPACRQVTTPTVESIPSLTATEIKTIERPTSSPTPTGEPTLVWTVQPTPEASQAATPTEIVTTATPEATRSTCEEAEGRVEVEELSTDRLPNPLRVRIYLPACYDKVISLRYPVLYLMHGRLYDDTQWERLGVPEIADRLIGDGELVPFIVVMPYDRSGMEPDRDPFGLAVLQDLIPWVDEQYRSMPEREWRAIGGLSRGGAWAAHLGFAHPELFGAVGMHSGVIFHQDVPEVQEWLEQLPPGRVPRIYLDIADKDRPEISGSASWLEELLTQLGIPHEWHMFTGEHEEEYWQAHVEDYLHWYAQGWNN